MAFIRIGRREVLIIRSTIITHLICEHVSKRGLGEEHYTGSGRLKKSGTIKGKTSAVALLA